MGGSRVPSMPSGKFDDSLLYDWDANRATPDDSEDKQASYVAFALIVICLYYFCKWFFSGKDRTVLVPVDQLNKQASADPLSSLESLMVSAVSRDYLGVQASFQKSRASS